MGDGIDWAAQDWDDLVPRLLLFAAGRLGRLTWRGRRSGTPPAATQAEDLVHDAIAKTIAGRRAWNADASTLFQHLAGVIASDVNHLAMSAENRETRSADDPAGESGTWPPDVADGSADPERAAAWRSEERALMDYLNTRDPLLARLAGLLLTHDIRENGELSTRLDVSLSEVANLRKRLRRAVQAFQQQQPGAAAAS